jgi:5-methylcytosine-specific restriction enzyme A
MRDHRSPEARRYRRLYNTRAWEVTRAEQLAREPFCRFCGDQGRRVLATICDHVDPTSKARDFYAGPFQSLCKPHHDSAKQAEEQRGYGGQCDASGWPTDPRHPANRARPGRRVPPHGSGP